MTACSGDVPSGQVPWRLQIDGPRPGFENMEVDEALVAAQEDPSALPVLRFFRWSTPTLTFGRLQDHHDAANRTMLLGARAMARRPTGGGTVVHDKDLSFSLSWRRDHPFFPVCLKNIYRGIHETARGALHGLGVETSLHKPAGRAAAGIMCFEEPVEDDLMWNGKKVLGGAMRVTARGRLYQGNLIWEEMGLDVRRVTGALSEAFEKMFFKTPPAV